MLSKEHQRILYSSGFKEGRRIDLSLWETQLLERGFLPISNVVRAFMQNFTDLDISDESDGFIYGKIRCIDPRNSDDWQLASEYVSVRLGECAYPIGYGRASDWLFLSKSGLICSEQDDYIFLYQFTGDSPIEIMESYLANEGNLLKPL